MVGWLVTGGRITLGRDLWPWPYIGMAHIVTNYKIMAYTVMDMKTPPPPSPELLEPPYLQHQLQLEQP